MRAMTARPRLLLRGAVAAAALAAIPLTTAPVHAQTLIPMLGCPLGCGTVQTDTLLAARMARAGDSLMLAAQETPGYMYNVRAMAEERRWENTVFGTEDSVIQAAIQGGRPGLKEFMPEEIPIRFQLLYGEGIVQQGKFFVTVDPDINSVADLKGKRVSIGLPTQSDWGMAASLLLEHGYGITKENTQIRNVTPAVMTQQLIDGNTDAALVALLTDSDGKVWWTNDLTSQIAASGQKIKYLPVSEDAINAVNEEFGMTLLAVNVPAGTLPAQNEDFLAGAVRAYKGVHPNFSEEAAYELVKAVHEHGPALKETNQGWWKFWSPSNMVAGLTEENTHPGAIRAYKELGIWDLREKYPSVKYPEVK